MKILGIETSCDETGAAVVEDGVRLLSNVVASQEEIHARYGGIVPEVAARQHLLTIIPVVKSAMERAEVSWSELSGVAVTYGPGLAGALLVGVNVAKALALAEGLPLIGVNHLEGHIYATWLEEIPQRFPVLCLIVSGGHTGLFIMEKHGHYRPLGGTRDDAAGEAFDKVARLLGLGFPGGPAIQRVSAQAKGGAYALPRAWLRGTHDFSFSGLKTAVLHLVEGSPAGTPQKRLALEDPQVVAEVAASFQEAVVDVLVTKAVESAKAHGAQEIILGGGVAANLPLREELARRSPVPVRAASPRLCTDNGAMIATCGYFRLQAGQVSPWDLDVYPSLKLA